MILPGNFTLKTLFWFMIICVFNEKTLGFPDGEKKFDIKLGFDLTQGSNGVPAIKIRPFKDSEFHPRAAAEGSSSGEATTQPTPRAVDSNSGGSGSDEKATEKNAAALKFDSSKQSSEESNNETEEEVNRYTKAGEYEPEDKKEGEASDTEGKRRKRSVKKNKNHRLRRNMKKIGNKFKSARKLGVSKTYG